MLRAREEDIGQEPEEGAGVEGRDTDQEGRTDVQRMGHLQRQREEMRDCEWRERLGSAGTERKERRLREDDREDQEKQ